MNHNHTLAVQHCCYIHVYMLCKCQGTSLSQGHYSTFSVAASFFILVFLKREILSFFRVTYCDHKDFQEKIS